MLGELAGQAEQNVLRWSGHMERMEEDRLVKRIVGSKRCKAERKAMNGMDIQCEQSAE